MLLSPMFYYWFPICSWEEIVRRNNCQDVVYIHKNTLKYICKKSERSYRKRSWPLYYLSYYLVQQIKYWSPDDLSSMSSVRFTVTKTEDDPMGESSTDPPAYGTTPTATDTPDVKIVDLGTKFGGGFTIIFINWGQ